MELPQDIINIIYTFNADHRENMKPVLKEISRVYFIRTYQRCVNYLGTLDTFNVVFQSIFKQTDHSDFIQVLRAVIEMKEYEIRRHLDFWGNCMCCRKHILDKPRIAENEYNYYYDQFSQYISDEDFHGPTYFSEPAFNNECNCVCRHFSRWIVRAYTNNYFI